MTFPGAGARRSAADYVLIGAPLDVAPISRPGARFGPDRIRQHARSFEDYDRATDLRFTDCGVHDAGDVDPWAAVDSYLDFLAETVGDVIDEGAVPLLLGGEHTVTVAGLRALNPDVFVCVDAHLDLREELGGDTLSHATVSRHALDIADEAVVLGARAGSEAEWKRASEPDVTVVPPADAADWSPTFASGADVYLSIDIDAVDPGFAPGTGTPEPFGLEPTTVHRIVRTIAGRCVGFDVVEVTDRDAGQAATLAAKLLRAFVYVHASE